MLHTAASLALEVKHRTTTVTRSGPLWLNSRQIFVGRRRAASVVDFDPRKEALFLPPEVFPVHLLSSQCPHGALEIHRQMVQKLFFSHISIVHSPGCCCWESKLCMKTETDWTWTSIVVEINLCMYSFIIYVY